MIETFLTWMNQPGSYNDIVVYMGIFTVVLIIGMIFRKD